MTSQTVQVERIRTNCRGSRVWLVVSGNAGTGLWLPECNINILIG